MFNPNLSRQEKYNQEIIEIVNPFERLAECTKRIVAHIKDEKYSRIIVSGGSRRVSKELFEQGWKKLYPDQQCPPIDEIDEEGNIYLYKDKDLEQQRKNLVKSYLTKYLPDLFKAKKEKICFLDEYAYKGTKIQNIKSILQKIGFTNIHFALFASSPIADIDKKTFIASPEDNVTLIDLKRLSRNIQGQDILPFDEQNNPENLKILAEKNLKKITAII